MNLDTTKMNNRPYVVAIGGFDPSGGAGILADIKTMEGLDVQGLAVLSARTVQTEDKFFTCAWELATQICTTIKVLADRYPIAAMKIGIMPSAVPLMRVLRHTRELLPNIPIVIDPVMRPSTSNSNYAFISTITPKFMGLLTPTDILTPNSKEFELLFKPLFRHNSFPYDTNMIVTGVEEPGSPSIKDILYTPKGQYEMQVPRIVANKHGTGCIYSSALASYLAKGLTLVEACQQAQLYVRHYLTSSPTLLGCHHFN